MLVFQFYTASAVDVAPKFLGGEYIPEPDANTGHHVFVTYLASSFSLEIDFSTQYAYCCVAFVRAAAMAC